jgi:ABC-type bacteriocin/lantibiotic exporter with double-glycine peptidase domain
MLIILESIQREIFVNEVHKWNHVVNKNHPHYYFEIHNLMKSFSKSYSSLIELGLLLAFGLATIILFHPVFLIASVLILITIWQIYKASESALKSSILESNEKYKIYDLVKAETEISEVQIKNFLQMRDNHFSFIRKNSLKISLLSVVIQSLILITGCYLVNINQLSLGQLVSAEIIVSGIFIAINKLPYSLEAIYDFETSKYKLKKVFGGNDE